LALTHPRAYIEDTSQAQFYDYSEQRNEEELNRRRQLYGDFMRRSKFILCPRGHGASSFRIFETLRAGRIPVILSDEWTEPDGPDWAGCSLRVQEKAVASLPGLLERQEPEFERMSANARQTYAAWFAPDVIFHQIIQQCAALMPLKPNRHAFILPLDRQYLRCGTEETLRALRYRAAMLRNRLLKRGPGQEST
ncbi:MAG: glycosyltransferase family 47 protein, partial [Armatimonadota bacterium]|nr:glycosyltransferase family 47 protein [Armatimonadota bacterium]